MATWLAAALILVTGCAAVDLRVIKEPQRQVESIEAFSGTYSNSPSYRSHTMGFIGPGEIGEVIGCSHLSPDSFRIIADGEKGLKFELLRKGELIDTKEFSFTEGLRFTKEGVIEFPRLGGFENDDSPVIGYGTKRYSLNLNRKNELVVVESGGGAGFVGIIPMGLYGKLMVIFPRQ